MKRRSFYPTLGILIAAIAACSDSSSPPTAPLAPAFDRQTTPPPAGLVAVSAGDATVQLWPYTGLNFEGTPQDPINLVFVGQGDARNVRDALLSLDGSRGVAPFNQSAIGMLLAGVAQGCTWSDAIGGHQVTYSDASDWAGSAIQLECGSFASTRFHVRLFQAGEWTVANAHLDVLIPGTQQHEVVTWEGGEAFVTMELARSGLLTAAPAATSVLNTTPTFGAIRPEIYNGLPAGLRLFTGGIIGSVTQPVPLPNDGRATLLSLADAPDAGGTSESFTLQFAQYIPKPFCAEAGELVRVDGPLYFQQEVRVSASGGISNRTRVEGELEVRTFDPATGALGPVERAEVSERYLTMVAAERSSVLATRSQRIFPEGVAPEKLMEVLQVSSGGPNKFRHDEQCND